MQRRSCPFGTTATRAPLPPNKGGSVTDPLGRGKGRGKRKNSPIVPKRPVKDRLKEPHDGVRSVRPAPSPTKGVNTSGMTTISSPALQRPRVPFRHPVTPNESINRALCRVIDGGVVPRRDPPKHKPKRSVIYQKLVLDDEPWNFKRSPSLKLLKKSIQRVKERNNPFYEFKDLFCKVKIRNLEEYNRYKSILEGGFFLTRRSIGIGIVPPIRKVKNLSFQDMEFLISKLPFWATSFQLFQMKELALAMYHRGPVGEHAKHCRS
jgi:hypothetical protein